MAEAAASAASPSSLSSSSSFSSRRHQSRASAQPRAAPPLRSSHPFLVRLRSFLSTAMLHLTASSSSLSSALLQQHQHAHAFTNSPAWLLGRCYRLLQTAPAHTAAYHSVAAEPQPQSDPSAAARAAFLSDLTSKLWFSYRSGFPAISPSHPSIVSDAGWGCMIRSAQMMFSYALLLHYLGRDWRRRSSSGSRADAAVGEEERKGAEEADAAYTTYVSILSWFLDSIASPYSIHAMLTTPALRPHHHQQQQQQQQPQQPQQLQRSSRRSAASRSALSSSSPSSSPAASPSSSASRFSSSSSSSAAASSPSASPSSSSSPPVGEWFGPTACCAMLVRCRANHVASAGGEEAINLPVIIVADDGTIYRDRVERRCCRRRGQPQPSPSSPASSASASPPVAFDPELDDFLPVILLIPVRLGLDKINTAYLPSLLSCFQFPQSIGMMGGKPRSSLYFIGVQDDRLFYLDPHTVQPALTHFSRLLVSSDAATYHTDRLLSMPAASIDPSLAIGFYIRSWDDWTDFVHAARRHEERDELYAVVRVRDTRGWKGRGGAVRAAGGAAAGAAAERLEDNLDVGELGDEEDEADEVEASEAEEQQLRQQEEDDDDFVLL